LNRDTIQTVISDLHVGSQYSICANRFWAGLNKRVHNPNADQLRIIKHFDNFADRVLELRRDKTLKLILGGDMIEGVIHGTNEVWTNNPIEMAEVAVEIIGLFQKRVDWQAGDELHCLRGTYRHSEDWEEKIGKELNAVVGANGYYSQDKAIIETNGKLTWAVHQGAVPGTGANEGDPIRNWLKTTYFNSLRDETDFPDISYSAHFHKPGYASYGWRQGWGAVGNMHGVVCPSWKLKDRFSAKVSRFEKCSVGGMTQLITAEGVIDTPQFFIMPENENLPLPKKNV
jgi:hypothetical protein